jgi:hypothetical protein
MAEKRIKIGKPEASGRVKSFSLAQPQHLMRNMQLQPGSINETSSAATPATNSGLSLKKELSAQASAMQKLLQMLENEKCPDKTQEILIFLQDLSQSFSDAVDRFNKTSGHTSNTGGKSVVAFEDIFEKVVSQITNLIFETNTVIEADFSQRRYVTTTHSHLESTMLNSLSNAIRNCQPGETPHISIRTFTSNGSTMLVISSNDHGDPDIYPENPDARGIGASINQEVPLEGRISTTGTTIKIRFNDHA